jgi:ribosomal protein L29
MKRTKKFEELRKQLETDFRNPGCIDLDAEIAKMRANKHMGQVNKPLLIGVSCAAIG